MSDSTGLVRGLLRGRGGHAGAGGAGFGEHGGLGPCGRGLHLCGHFDGLDGPEGAGDVPSRAGTALERGLSVLEELGVQGAGGLRGGGHHRGGFQGLQRVQDDVGRVFDAALPLQLPQLVQG